MTLGEMISKGGRDYPNKIALKFKGNQWTYQELEEQTNKVANGLKRLGIRKGDRVGILMANSAYFVISYFAIVKVGAIVVPINIMFKGPEVAYMLNDAKASALVTAPMFAPLVNAIRGQLETVNHIIIDDSQQASEVPESVSLNDLLNIEQEELQLEYSISEDDTAVFLYTSGTTGRPKGAMLTHDNIIFNAAASHETIAGLLDKEIALCVLPMFHSYAWSTIVVRPLYIGATVVILESFVPQLILKTIAEEKINLMTAVPAMFNMLLHVPNVTEFDISSLKLVFSGGSSLPAEIIRRFNDSYGIKILEGYGLSECSPVCAVNPSHGICKPGSIGLPQAGL